LTGVAESLKLAVHVLLLLLLLCVLLRKLLMPGFLLQPMFLLLLLLLLPIMMTMVVLLLLQFLLLLFLLQLLLLLRSATVRPQALIVCKVLLAAVLQGTFGLFHEYFHSAFFIPCTAYNGWEFPQSKT
jgi:hypothetical protein